MPPTEPSTKTLSRGPVPVSPYPTSPDERRRLALNHALALARQKKKPRPQTNIPRVQKSLGKAPAARQPLPLCPASSLAPAAGLPPAPTLPPVVGCTLIPDTDPDLDSDSDSDSENTPEPALEQSVSDAVKLAALMKANEAMAAELCEYKAHGVCHHSGTNSISSTPAPHSRSRAGPLNTLVLSRTSVPAPAAPVAPVARSPNPVPVPPDHDSDTSDTEPSHDQLLADDTGRIPVPTDKKQITGEAIRKSLGYGARDGIKDDHWLELNGAIRTLMTQVNLDLTCPWTEQDKVKVGSLYTLINKYEPRLNKFKHNWATEWMVQSRFNNKRYQDKKKKDGGNSVLVREARRRQRQRMATPNLDGLQAIGDGDDDDEDRPKGPKRPRINRDSSPAPLTDEEYDCAAAVLAAVPVPPTVIASLPVAAPVPVVAPVPASTAASVSSPLICRSSSGRMAVVLPLSRQSSRATTAPPTPKANPPLAFVESPQPPVVAGLPAGSSELIGQERPKRPRAKPKMQLPGSPSEDGSTPQLPPPLLPPSSSSGVQVNKSGSKKPKEPERAPPSPPPPLPPPSPLPADPGLPVRLEPTQMTPEEHERSPAIPLLPEPPTPSLAPNASSTGIYSTRARTAAAAAAAIAQTAAAETAAANQTTKKTKTKQSPSKPKAVQLSKPKAAQSSSKPKRGSKKGKEPAKNSPLQPIGDETDDGLQHTDEE